MTREAQLGRWVFHRFDCHSCHVQDWEIKAADLENPDVHRRYLGDLRFFDLDVTYNDETNRLEGRLERLYDVNPSTGEFVPRRILPLSLSYDHRVIDGADAARFTRLLAEYLSDMRRILL